MTNPYISLIRAVWQNGKPWRFTIVCYYLAFIIAQVFISLSPYTLGRTIDVLQHFKPGRLHEVIFWLGAGIAVWLLFWLFHGPARVKERDVAMKIQQAYRARIYEQLTQLPLKWHQDHHSGNTISRVNRAAQALYRFAGDQFIFIQTIIKFVVSIAFLLWLSLPVGLCSLTICMVSVGMVFIFDRILIPLYHAQNEIDNHVGALTFDYISNATTILTLRLQDLTRNNLVQRMLSIWPSFRKEMVWNEVKWFCVGTLLTTLQALVLIIYIIQTLDATNAIVIGVIVMIFRYQWDLSEVFFSFSSTYSELVRMDADIKGMQPVLDDIERYAHVTPELQQINQWQSLQVSDLSFHHSGHHYDLLFQSLAFSVKRGEKIALIGESGGGKSTLLNIIRGLYTPESGRLTIDGQAFPNLEPLQSFTTLIPQDPEIFENTIKFNITLDLMTDEAEIMAAVKLAKFDKVLKKLPSGLETDIREKGLNLSVGQKQRLALARGLFAARFSSLILMDEPTSSVDLPTEKEILTGVMNAFPDTALIVSLHRLHLLPRFDRIIMLDHGKIVADGAASEILHQPGPVQALWRSYQDKH